jgi:hypothetical protein
MVGLTSLPFVAAAQAVDPVTVPGGTIRVEFARPAPALDAAALRDWVDGSARAVAAFYGRFPVDTVRLLVTPGAGRGVGNGRTWADARGGLIRIRVGEATGAREFADDWVLVHEMTHLALPSLPDDQSWLEEGLATYVESIARAQAGALSEEAVWRGFVQGMPNGLPQRGDRGLDRTHTWGRTYWGGALFCLLADLQIRRETGNRRGLQDALRGILADRNMQTESPIAPVLAAGDRATGTSVLATLYARMKNAPVPTDLASLWSRLGVIPDGRTVRFDDDAPEATLRRSLTERRS